MGFVCVCVRGGGEKANRQTNKQTNEQLNKWSNNKGNYSKRSNQGMGVVLFIKEKYSLIVIMRVKWIEVT